MVNKKFLPVILATLITVGIVGGTTTAFAQVVVTKTTIVTNAESTPTLSDLVKALNATNLTATLNDTTKNFTVFAPSNTAFSALGNVTLNDLLTNNTTKLSTILLNHVVQGRQNLTTNGSAITLGGNTITWTVTTRGGTVTLGNSTANMTGPAVNTTNGLVQPIDGVLTPPAAATAAASASAAGGFLGLPGFEAVYAVAGLLVVAYLVMRRRR
ncbi:MAG TPA: fasciclin domain-containing protein [Candidatus Acidoferrales bacterium]|jgi:PGF-CTERM protein|nr:fasciclin domain-containing protein [Candidatus Acidoferrales bacterium]